MPSTKNVLIVEDEPLIAMMLENFLEVLDRGVAGVADSVRSALDMIGSVPCDAVILDMNLHGENSAPVAEELSRKGIPFLVASGGSIHDGPEIFRGRPRLAKPFTLSGMEQALDAL